MHRPTYPSALYPTSYHPVSYPTSYHPVSYPSLPYPVMRSSPVFVPSTATLPLTVRPASSSSSSSSSSVATIDKNAVILVASATAKNLSKEIVEELLNAGYKVRAFTSDGTKPAIEHLKAIGAEIFVGNLSDYESCVKACTGVAGVIAVLAPSVEASLTSQANLLKAAIECKVQRFIPAQWGFDSEVMRSDGDYCVLSPAVHEFLTKHLIPSGMKYTVIIAGGFMDTWLPILGCLPDEPSPPSRVRLIGKGNVPSFFNADRDIAKVAARAILDPRVVNKTIVADFNFVSQEGIIREWEKVSGKTVQRSYMTRKELDEHITNSQANPAAFFSMLMGQLIRLTFDDFWPQRSLQYKPQPRLRVSQLYPDLVGTTVTQWMQQYHEKTKASNPQ
jgi:hypothetical protein